MLGIRQIWLAGIALPLLGCATASLPDFMHGENLNWDGVSSEWRGDTFHYWTGSSRGGAGFNGDIPSFAHTASAQAGAVSVQVRSRTGDPAPAQNELAASTATVLERVTTQVWPGEAVPTNLQLYLVDREERIGFHQRATWEAGATWDMHFATKRDLSNTAAMSAHELYHLLIAAQRIERPDADRIYEEVAARFYGGCGLMLAGLDYDFSSLPHVTISMPDAQGGALRDFVPPFSDDDLAIMIERVDDAVETDQTPPFVVHLAFVMTALVEVSDGARVIEHGSPQADRLLQLCRTVGGEPPVLRNWFLEIASDGVDAAVTR